MVIKTKLFLIALLAFIGIAVFLFWDSKPDIEVVDTNFNGVYQFPGGQLATIVPSTSSRFRLRYDNGNVQSLYHNGTPEFEVANGFSDKKIVATGNFFPSKEDNQYKIAWRENDKSIFIESLPLQQKEIYFKSGELTLRGKLTMPPGEGPFPVVIMIHGSEAYSAVDYYSLPYRLAAHGIAGFKFDKRGTGLSEGEYTQHFPTLANDVVAAANMLKTKQPIDSSRINLAGFSQGGWVAPLVAQKIDIQSIMVGYGCAIPVPREDRWGYVYQLLDKGFGQQEIEIADEMNRQLDKIIENGDDSAWDRLFELRDQNIDKSWFRAIAGSDSLLGTVAEKALGSGASFTPNAAWKVYFDWKRGDGPNFNRSYQPLDILKNIDTPSLWLLAGEDSSVPTTETTEVLEVLQKMGKKIEFKVYAQAEHGNVLFHKDETGQRVYTGYAPSYYSDMVEWFKSQNGI